MQPSAERIWGTAQEHLRSMLSQDTYNLWFAPLRACGQDNNTLLLEVANDFCEVWLKDNYMSLLQDVVAVASGRQLQIKFKVGPGVPAVSPAESPAPKIKALEAAAERALAPQEPVFNPKNTFDTFVVGNNKNFAYAASPALNGGLLRTCNRPMLRCPSRFSTRRPSSWALTCQMKSSISSRIVFEPTFAVWKAR